MSELVLNPFARLSALRQSLRRQQAAYRRPRSEQQRMMERVRRGFFVGRDAAGAMRGVPFKALESHAMLVGKTGRGKTYLLYSLLVQILLAGFPVVVIDGKGDLYDRLLELCFLLGKRPDQVALVNPHDRQHAVGLNYLQAFGGVTPENHAKVVLSGFQKLFGEDGRKVWLEEWMPPALSPLIRAGLSLAELYPMVGLGDESKLFRQALLAGGPRFAQQKWAELGSYPKGEQANITRILRTRASFVMNSTATLPMLGQRHTTIPWDQMLSNPGSVVLASLGKSQHVQDEEGRLVGVTMLHQILATMWRRRSLPEQQRQRCFVVIDEASRFADRELAQAAEVMRGLGCSLILAFQTLAQLEQEDEFVARNIIGNMNTVLAFSTSRRDAEVLAEELYSGCLDFNQVKQELYATKFRPVESTRTTESHATGSARATSSGQGEHDSSGHGEGKSWVEGAHGQDGMLSSSESSQRGTSYSSSQSSGTSESFSSSTSAFHEMHEFQELTSRDLIGLPELWERAIASLKRQGVRQVTVGYGDAEPMSLRTSSVRFPFCPPDEVATFREASNRMFARPSAEVLAEIEGRVGAAIAEHRKAQRAISVEARGATATTTADPLSSATEVEVFAAELPDEIAIDFDLGEGA